MKSTFDLSPTLEITRWVDAFGPMNLQDGRTEYPIPGFRLVRYDDAWRPLAGNPATLSRDDAGNPAAIWEDTYGGAPAYGRPPDVTFPHFWPAAFDAWPYSGDIKDYSPMRFRGTVQTRVVQSAGVTGIEWTITIQDLRAPSRLLPQQIIRMPVGIRCPLPADARAYGCVEMFGHSPDPALTTAHQLESDVRNPEFPAEWYYLESELFGMRSDSPARPFVKDPAHLKESIHVGAPVAAWRGEGRLWTAIASEPDYGAATLWSEGGIRHFSTLYLKPGGTAHWKFVVWRQETDQPSRILLSATRTGGFFDALNPRDFAPKGPPEGPTLFDCISRLPTQMEQIRILRPRMVFLNFFWDHIGSLANCYGEWRSYEGFSLSESKMKSLIAELRSLNCKVGVYTTTPEAAESSRVVQDDDFLLDRWGRRFHAWEPGNWVIDPGHGDLAERLAKAEAEFCRHYGIDAAFIDRQDYMAVNANPARVGSSSDARLELIPSLRLGMILQNKKRMEYHRRINPGLSVGLNNTTLWAGVRYSDFNHLESGSQFHDLALPWLMQPSGIINLAHCGPLFLAGSGLNLFQVVGEQIKKPSFAEIVEELIRCSLVSGVEAQPYGDELFVDCKSTFFREGFDKDAPDEQKQALIDGMAQGGGQEWREMWEKARPALEAAAELVRVPICCWKSPDSGNPLPADFVFFAAEGEAGGFYAGMLNPSQKSFRPDHRVGGLHLEDEVPAGKARMWWKKPGTASVETIVF